MTWGYVAMAGVSVAGSLISAEGARSAGNNAADAQKQAAAAGIGQQKSQFDAIQQLLAPYVTAGTGAVGKQGDLIGLNGSDAQQSSISALQNSPQFSSMLKLGENRILANASATGGLRGGNVQAAMGQFSPQLLSQLIQQQYQNLGGLTSIGQNAAAGVGNAGMQTGNQITGLLGQQGAAQAGAFLNQGAQSSNMVNSVAGGIGLYKGLGGTFGSSSQAAPTINLGDFASYAPNSAGAAF